MTLAAHTPAEQGQTIRVSPAAYGALKLLAQEDGQPMVRCLEALVQDASRQRLWARYAEANRQLQADPKARATYKTEQDVWAVADADGLNGDEGIAWSEELTDAATW